MTKKIKKKKLINMRKKKLIEVKKKVTFFFKLIFFNLKFF